MPERSLSDSDLDELIIALLSAADGPVSLARITRGLPRAYKIGRARIEGRVGRLVADARVHRWPRSAFGLQSEEEDAAVRIRQLLSAEALTTSEIAKRARLKATVVKRVTDAMVRTGAVLRHPQLGRRKPLGLTAPPVKPYAEALLDGVIAALAKKGFDEEAAWQAIAEISGASPAPAVTPSRGERPRPEQVILDAIRELTPRGAGESGAHVFLPHVRVAVADAVADKGAFDRALLALLSNARIDVHTHPVPSQLSEREKEELVPDGRGGYFLLVGLR